MIHYSLHYIEDFDDYRMYRFGKSSEILDQPNCVFPPPEAIYKKVYEEGQRSFNPDEVLTRFNLYHPKDFKERSVSVSDVIRYYLPNNQILNLFCNGSGYIAVDFRPEYRMAKEPEYTPPTATNNELVTHFYKQGDKTRTVTVDLNRVFPRRYNGIDQDGNTVALTPAEVYNSLRARVIGRHRIRQKEYIKSITGWQDSYLPEFGDYVHPGDYVTQSMVDHYLNILPPIRYRAGYFQAGGMICDCKNEKGIPRACYMTFVKPDAEWIYAGVCFEGKDENLLPVKTLFDQFAHLMELRGAL